MVILFLTCKNDAEADQISQALLVRRLVACTRKISTSSTFVWEGKINQTKEVLLMMETVESKFDRIEAQIRQLHSYQTFVLTAVPVTSMANGVSSWLQQSMG